MLAFDVSASFRPVPVTILTGFLGSGKTTLLNRILGENHPRRIGVLVNDFGDVNIDARLVQSMEGEAIDLSNGCVCCSMRGGLVQSTVRMLERPNPPDYVIVEASGISDPVGVAGAFRTSTLRERVVLDGIVGMVDAENVRDPRLDQQLIALQMAASDFVVLNKIDLVDGATREDLHTWITELVPSARVIEASYAQVPLDVLLGAGGEPAAGPAAAQDSEHRHHHDFETWTYRTERPLALRKVREALHQLPTSVFRAKGVIYPADAPNLAFAVHLVGRRVSVDVLGERGEADCASHLVVIGRRGSLDRQALTELFDATVTPAILLLPAANFRKLRCRQPFPTAR